MLDFDSLLDTAKSAAILAGKNLLTHQGQQLEVLLNQGRDIKLQLDLDTEKLIKEHIASESSYPILGEETGVTEDLGEFYWVVDPLDGTSNFLRDIPISCVSIGLMHKLNPVLGVIYDFNHDDLYCGHQNASAFLNQEEIKVSDCNLKTDSTLATGIPAKTHYSDGEFKSMITDFQEWKKIRMIGSAAMAGVYVAAGKVDAYKENGIFLWDVAAAAAIVSAAGGSVSLVNFQPNYRVDATFTNNKLEA